METIVKEKSEFRNYEQGDITAAVKDHYYKMRTRQTYDYVQRMKKKYLTFERPMDLWDMMDRLNALIDVSDPDLNLPNSIHLLQSAEGIRQAQRRSGVWRRGAALEPDDRLSPGCAEMPRTPRRRRTLESSSDRAGDRC